MCFLKDWSKEKSKITSTASIRLMENYFASHRLDPATGNINWKMSARELEQRLRQEFDIAGDSGQRFRRALPSANGTTVATLVSHVTQKADLADAARRAVMMEKVDKSIWLSNTEKEVMKTWAETATPTELQDKAVFKAKVTEAKQYVDLAKNHGVQRGKVMKQLSK